MPEMPRASNEEITPEQIRKALSKFQFSANPETCSTKQYIYRGQKLPIVVLQKMQDNRGSLISMYGFLSTTKYSAIGADFACVESNQDEYGSVIFQMEIDRANIVKIVCADIENQSQFKQEGEILFSVGSIWKLESIEKMDYYWMVELSFCNDIDSHLTKLDQRLMNGCTFLSLGNILRELGDKSNAENYYYRMMDDPNLSNDVRGHTYYNIGTLAAEQGRYGDALKNIQTAEKLILPRTESNTCLKMVDDLSITMNENYRDIFLYGIACGSTLRTLNWRACSYQTHHAESFCDWLFQCSTNLHKYQLLNTLGESGFELSYHHTLINSYQFHPSLIFLKINILNLSTLFVLLHYLPKLEWLDVHISNPIEVENDFNKNLSNTMDYPIKLHTLKFRTLNIQGRGCYELENLLLNFVQSLESLSISMYHRCDNEPDLNYDGYSLSILCQKFLHLRSFHFALQIQMFERADENIINNFVNTFSTPFWLNGPFGCKRVCVDFEQIYGWIQMF
ncbi:unnamed protein product, partial [Adineta steineri]